VSEASFRGPPRDSEPRTSVAWMLGESDLPFNADPGRFALRWGDHDLTYGELRTRALHLAGGLRASGLGAGDRVATLLYNRGEIFELYFACAYAGLTLVPVNFRMVAGEVEYVLRDSGARVLVTEPALRDTAAAALATLTDVRLITLHEDGYGPEYEDLAARSGASSGSDHTEIQLILYTSGTTGRPKGVMLSHTAIMWFAFQQVAMYPFMRPEMVMLATGPTYNTASINEQTIPTFLAGGTVAIQPSRGWRPEKMAALIHRYGVTHANIFPVMMERILQADSRERIDLGTLTFVLTGGENTPPATVRRFRERWKDLSVAIGYGLTEGGVITWIRDCEIDQHPLSVGRSFGGQTFRVVDGEGRPVARGETGEVVTAGPALMSGYWNAPDLTARSIRDGWLWTGDLGRQDDDGYLYIEGRSKDMVISGSHNIYPAEIENALSEHPGLADWTVIGVPDAEWGEAVCAVVVAKQTDSVTSDEVVGFVRGRLASYKKPKYVVFRSELPRNASGKVLKASLRDELRDLERGTTR
jgi:acyl-CoA synthetase (AMP-forming)/AMP-acid ligase II